MLQLLLLRRISAARAAKVGSWDAACERMEEGKAVVK